jgi:hypothetical protein
LLDTRGSNVATFTTTSGYKKFNAFCTECSVNDNTFNSKPLILNSSTASNSEEGDNDDLDDQQEVHANLTTKSKTSLAHSESSKMDHYLPIFPSTAQLKLEMPTIWTQ